MPEEKARRAPNPKVKTGCTTCKRRHVKCDEQKPECQRCIKAGFKCEGFPTNGQKNTSAIRAVGSAGSSCQMTSRVLTISISGNRKERRGLAYFRERTVLDLSGFFYSNFWSRLVLQYGQSEPAVQHALVALSSMHENLSTSSSTSAKKQAELNRRFSLQQYNKSLQLLSTSVNRGSHPSKVVLICCLIFFCIESLCSNYEAAFTHLQSGLDILHEHQRQYWGSFSKTQADAPKSKPLESIENDLVQMFLQLDIQASSFAGVRQPQLVAAAEETLRDAQSIPCSFSSAHEAKAWLERLSTLMYALVQFHPNDAPLQTEAESDFGRLSAQYRQYETAVDALLKDTRISMTGKDIQGIMLLKLQLLTTRLILLYGLARATRRPNPSKEYTSQFGVMIILARAIIRNSNASTIGLGREVSINYSFDLGVVGPLFLAATQSSDMAIRREAIALLRESQRKEGLWDGALAAEIAERETDAVENGRPIPEKSTVGGITGLARFYGIATHTKVDC